MKQKIIARSLATIVVACGVLAACGSGPSEAEFVQACVASSSPQMGVDEKMCSCAAHEAKSNLPAVSYRAMVLTMQGKKQEAEALLGDMPFEKRAEFGMKQFEILGKCFQDT